MKHLKKTASAVILCFFISLCLSVVVCANQSATDENSRSPAFPQIELSQQTKEDLSYAGINKTDYNWYEDFDISSVLSAAVKTAEENYRRPLILILSVCGVVIIQAALLSKINDDRFASVITVSCAVAILTPLFKVIEQTASVLDELSNFMLAFFPAFLGVLAASGKSVTAAAVSPVITGAVTVFNKVICGVFLPFTGCYLAMSVCSGVATRIRASLVCEKVKNAVLWALGGVAVIFIGILTAVSTATTGADRLGIRAGKYLAGTIPAVGSAISESLSLAVSSAAAVKGSFGGFGIVCIAAVLLPSLITLLLYKGALVLGEIVCDSFLCNHLKTFIKNLSGALSVIIGALVFSGIAFIISLSVITGV